ncbi:serine/threonine protein kinase [Saprolegnia diclina VS20]|uniref:Serine/threonine protein kinase n=1 Tax=Saprolegnia diclina (strain VS20) TaxID=1156394 RepID=T0QZS4_SAPDV|nr:serine/threonine protein kinase [Saprolegnia diclina VS20]EQC25238.1 serine/threonine protein kinase [Saprolegnia diclina VS20]|eukprot:XP_008621322.1 serine/threonine protein kinase [Saprolegnia diclina VS20]
MGGNLSALIINTPVDVNTNATEVELLVPELTAEQRIAQLETQLKHEREDKARLVRDHREALQRIRDVTTAAHASLQRARNAGLLLQKEFPFAVLTPGRLQSGDLALRIQLKPAFQKDAKVVLRFKQTMAIMQALRGGGGSLLRIFGANQLESNDPVAYVEYVTGMTLQRYLCSKTDASWSEKLHIAVQVATAIAHMHNLAVMHRDLSWLCVYVDATGHVKARWSAPETLATTDAVSYDDKIDIFGLGLLLIAFVTRDLPFMHVLTPKGKHLDDDLLCRWFQDPKRAQELVTSDFGDSPSDEYNNLALACIQLDPERRPTAPEVVRRLEAMLLSYGGPLSVTKSDATVHLAVAVHNTFAMTFEPTFGDAYALECVVSVDDASRKPVKFSNKKEGTKSHIFDSETTFDNIDPVDWTLQLIFKTPGYDIAPFGTSFGGRHVGKATIPLVEFLKAENNPRSLSAPREKVCDIYGYGKDGDTIGKVALSVAFRGQLRERLEDYEAHIANAIDVTADVHEKRNVVAQALLRDAP